MNEWRKEGRNIEEKGTGRCQVWEDVSPSHARKFGNIQSSKMHFCGLKHNFQGTKFGGRKDKVYRCCPSLISALGQDRPPRPPVPLTMTGNQFSTISFLVIAHSTAVLRNLILGISSCFSQSYKKLQLKQETKMLKKISKISALLGLL